MQVLFFASGDLGEGNAANARFICYGKGLNTLGIDHHFYLVAPTEFNDNQLNKSSEGTVEGVSFSYLDGRSTRRATPATRAVGRVKSWWNGMLKLTKVARKNTVLYFYGPQAFTTLPLLLWGKFLGFRIIVEQTELHSLRHGRKAGLKAALSRWSHRVVEQNLGRLCDHLFVISRRLRWYYRLKFPNLSIEVLPIIYDPARFDNVENTEQTFRLGYLGSFGEKDGLPGILDAFQQARKNLPALKLRLIGYQNQSFDLDAALDTVGLNKSDPQLEITGQVLSKDIPRLLSDCDTLIQNRTGTLYANYGFPTKLVEYLATGRPVISTNVSDIGCSLEGDEDLVLIGPDDSQGLSKAMLHRYHALQQHNEIGEKGKRSAARRYEYSQHVRNMVFHLRPME